MEGKYKPGALTDIIVQHSQQHTNEVKTTKVKAKLASLFSEENAAQNKQKRKQKVTEESDSPSGAVEGYQPPPGIVHEALLKKKKRTDTKKERSKSEKETKRKEEIESSRNSREKQRKNRKKSVQDKTRDLRTVFVGNWPLSLQKKDLRKLFKTCGKIDSVRFRCPPTKDPRISKKVISIKRDFHPERSTIVGFVCFEEEKSAQKALQLNGREVEGRHIRVDLASKSKEHNHKCSVFVGNLDVKIDEEQIWNHFMDCGEIVSVRIIRDSQTGLGKGFCYVQFESPDAVGLASRLNGSQLASRELRVMRSQENPVLPKKTGIERKGKPQNPKKNFKDKNEGTTVHKGKTAKQLKKDKKFKKQKSSAAKKIRKHKAIFSNSFKNSRENDSKMNKNSNSHKPRNEKSKGK
ncbi:RNA-binding protein 34-like [Ylistrum balloti]|uniref:RNA-binding protein 34-like n=1 Tax=Ylistrum balloti TaxID=509963 RepID=UPI002905EE91|nr:RNA-binding protein 34-like [Ylistrum balloti]XP_060068432.1 RNA-binding protein 34-like [Ylistrum balloti]